MFRDRRYGAEELSLKYRNISQVLIFVSEDIIQIVFVFMYWIRRLHERKDHHLLRV